VTENDDDKRDDELSKTTPVILETQSNYSKNEERISFKKNK